MLKAKVNGINYSTNGIPQKVCTHVVTFLLFWSLALFTPSLLFAQNSENKLFIDVHKLEPGKVTFEDVAAAHKKDLAIEGKYDAKFIKFWVDEEAGKVYCLSEAPNAHSVFATHQEAHGLLPASILEVSDGEKVALTGGQLFLDIHHVAPGSVTAEMVAGAHEKDLAVEGKHGVRFINYWLDEKEGVIMCLSEAPNPEAIISTHKEAHGLLPSEVMKVQEGN